MSIVDSIYGYAEQSDIIDTEHVLPLGIGSFVVVAFYLDVYPVMSMLGGLDNSGLVYILVPAFKGVLGGVITTLIYTAGDMSFRLGETMLTKEKAMGVVLGAMLGIGFAVDFLAPEILISLSYTVLQLTGLLFALTLVHIHILVPSWRLENEWPHLLSGFAVFIAPYL